MNYKDSIKSFENLMEQSSPKLQGVTKNRYLYNTRSFYSTGSQNIIFCFGKLTACG